MNNKPGAIKRIFYNPSEKRESEREMKEYTKSVVLL